MASWFGEKNEEGKKNYAPVSSKSGSISCRFPFLSPIIYPIGKLCKCHLPNIAQSDVICEYRPLLALGLFWMYVLRKILLPFTGGVYALSVVHAAKKQDPACDPARELIRANELPLYPAERECRHCAEKSLEAIPEKNLLEETITCVRKELWFFMDQSKVVKAEVAVAIASAMDNASNGLDFLRAEENLVPRVGAIALGGLTGLILALRRGVFKKLLYTSFGSGAMAALCYPTEAKQYSKEALEQSRKYALIGYHFVNGVSRDLFGYQLPPLPTLSHFIISDSPHPPPEGVPSAEHLLPPTVTPVHIPLPGEEEENKAMKNQKTEN